MKRRCVAYEGTEFTIEWYFNEKGKSEAFDYFEELSSDRKKKFFGLIRLLGDTGKIFNEEKFRYEGDQIYALKPSPDRFLCFFFAGSKVIITNAYEKKTVKIPPREKSRAIKIKKDYIQRIKTGKYYD